MDGQTGWWGQMRHNDRCLDTEARRHGDFDAETQRRGGRAEKTHFSAGCVSGLCGDASSSPAEARLRRELERRLRLCVEISVLRLVFCCLPLSLTRRLRNLLRRSRSASRCIRTTRGRPTSSAICLVMRCGRCCRVISTPATISHGRRTSSGWRISTSSS